MSQRQKKNKGLKPRANHKTQVRAKKGFGVLEPSMPDLEIVFGVATCAENLEPVLVSELKVLGAKVLKSSYKAVYFRAERSVFLSLHRGLGSAGRIQIFIKEIAAGSSRILFDKARRIKWGEWFAADTPLAIKVKTSEKENHEVSVSDVGSKIREAIKDHFRFHHQQDVCSSSYGSKLSIVAYLHGKGCQISLETHGRALHQREYREPGHPAPIKENLAYAILKMCGFNGDCNVIDLCTGSGTFAIEAAQMILNREPNCLRKSEDFGVGYLHSVSQEEMNTKNELNKNSAFRAVANDINSEALTVAKACAVKANVDTIIDFKQADMLDLKSTLQGSGLIVGNLPYDERLTQQELGELYKKLSLHLKQHFSGWKVGLLVAEQSPWEDFPFELMKKKKLKNGTIPIRLIIFVV